MKANLNERICLLEKIVSSMCKFIGYDAEFGCSEKDLKELQTALDNADFRDEHDRKRDEDDDDSDPVKDRFAIRADFENRYEYQAWYFRRNPDLHLRGWRHWWTNQVEQAFVFDTRKQAEKFMKLTEDYKKGAAVAAKARVNGGTFTKPYVTDLDDDM